MGIETNPQSVVELNSNWPANGEPAKEGAAHLRNIKRAVKVRANTSGVVGVTTLSSAIDSDAEDVAATSKAVKDLSDALQTSSEDLSDALLAFETAVEDAIENLQFQQVASQNGYVKLPNGVIFQWGKGQANYLANSSSVRSFIQFPIPFPTACFNVTCTEEVEANYSHNAVYETAVAIRGITRTQFQPVNMKIGDRGGTGRHVQVFWFAVGH